MIRDRMIKPERMDYMEKGAGFGRPREYNRREVNKKAVIMLPEFEKHTIILTGKEIKSLMKCMIITKIRLGGMAFPIPPDTREKIDGDDIENLWFRLNRKLKEREKEDKNK